MSTRDTGHSAVRPRTAVLTRGFDPSLSFGSARPAVFRSSTYVFATPEAAEHAFAITTGKIQPAEGERADLIYSRFSHPNAEILEDQIVPLEARRRRRRRLQLRHGRHHDRVLRLRPPRQLHRLHHAALRRHHRPDPHFPGTLRRARHPRARPATPRPSTRPSAPPATAAIVYLETPANPTLIMTDIERAAEAAQRHPDQPVVMVDNTFLGPTFQHPLLLGADMALYSATKYLSGFSDMVAGVALAKERRSRSRNFAAAAACSATSCSPTSAGCWMAACPPCRSA